MGKIHLLTDDVINKIAAGEVVDRPSSIVKELVENALDAGATFITVELEEGGIKRITVRDNGSGMTRDDAILALRRHATSKISRAEDLFSIQTKGFRGEALASISAVSVTQLRTRTRDAEAGISIVCRGGENAQADEWRGVTGTEITVTELFHNIPARAAFLKSAASEYASCLEVVQSLAVIGGGVTFVLLHNGKERLRCDRTDSFEGPFLGEPSLRQRAAVLFDSEVIERMLYCKKESEFAQLEILLSPPGLTRATQKYITTYVNGRLIRDRGIKSAIVRGYHSHLMHGQSPIAILNLWVNQSLVDVNVHPAKTEIRLQYAPDIQSTVAIAIREVLRSGEWSEMQRASTPSTSDLIAPDRSFGRGDFTPPRAVAFSSRDHVSSAPRESFRSSFATSPEFERAASPMASAAVNLAPEIGRIPWDELRPAGSAFDCYLLFESQDRMLVIDQHAFHERILYERLIKDRAQVIRSQPLLVPEVVDLSAVEIESLVERQTILSDLGFVFEKVADTSIEVRSIPSLLTKRSIEVVMGSLASIEVSRFHADPAVGLMHEVLSTIACHSAIRAGEQLSTSELQLLQSQSDDVDFYHNCPHGRRVFKWWTEAQVAAWFDR